MLVLTIAILVGSTNCGKQSQSEKIVQDLPTNPTSTENKVMESKESKESKEPQASKVPNVEPKVQELKRVEKPKIKSASKGITPARIYIPAIDVHADIEPVSVTSKGQMGVPNSTGRVGYLSSGILPGAVGNAIMDGHVDSYEGPAVFFDLKKLKKGDSVIVKNDKGYSIPFIVESVESFRTSEAPIQRIFGHADEPRLNLITCTGKYSRKKREHEERLIVFTKRLMDKSIVNG
ncbi:class F sortase [Cohnella herbarum]|uniref:class F sortase n=1 Tax=Cohnella herbarum TaxID=2728023 RepID=UPI0020C3406F|nr:class F sortase [Cohnella herbarum]